MEESVFGREEDVSGTFQNNAPAPPIARISCCGTAAESPQQRSGGSRGGGGGARGSNGDERQRAVPAQHKQRQASDESDEDGDNVYGDTMPSLAHLTPQFIAERDAALRNSGMGGSQGSSDDDGETGSESPSITSPRKCKRETSMPAQNQSNRSAHAADASGLTKEEEEEEKQFVSEFGFVMDEEEKNREDLYIKTIDGKQVVRREIKWAHMASDWDRTNSKMHAKLKERCRKGIPGRFRGIAWQLLLGCRTEMGDPRNSGVYEALKRKTLRNKEIDEIISRDLARTFPTHVLFRDRESVGQTLLRNILHAYACIDPEVGYVQGMGFIVGALTTQMGEEETFWAFHSMMTGMRYLMREMFRPGFPMLQQFFYQLKRLMARILPKLYRHFEAICVDPSFYAAQWFLTLFVYHFQFRALLRIWDIFMCEGWKIIFRVALALMKWEEKRLLELELDGVLPLLKNLHEGKNPDEILSRAHKIKFQTVELNRYGEEYRKMQLDEQRKKLMQNQ